MARVQLLSFSDGVIQTSFGHAVTSASVQVFTHDTTSPVTIFADEFSGATLAQPLQTDNKGRIPGWVDAAQRLDILCQGVTTPLEAFTGIGPAGPTGPQGPIGPPGANFRGAYNAGTTYASGDWVSGSDGLPYVSLAGGNVGHDPVSDGGVHWQSWLPAAVVSDSSADAASPVIATSGSRHRAIRDIKSIMDYGAVGAGQFATPSAGQILADTTAINAAVNADHRAIYFPYVTGGYIFDPSVAGSLDPPADQLWYGDGPLRSMIWLVTGATLPIVNSATIKAWHLHNIGFKAQSTTYSDYPSPPAALVVTNANLSMWRNVFFWFSPSDGLHSTCDSISMEGLRIVRSQGNGAVFTLTATGSGPTVFIGCASDIEYNGGDGLVFNASPGVGATEVSRTVVRDSHLEGNGGNNIVAETVGGGLVTGCYSSLAPIKLGEQSHRWKVADNTLIASPVHDGGWGNIVENNSGLGSPLALPVSYERHLPASRVTDPDGSSRAVLNGAVQAAVGGGSFLRTGQVDEPSMRMLNRTARMPLSITGAAGKGVADVVAVTAGDTYMVDVFWWVNHSGAPSSARAQIQIVDAGSSTVLFDSGTLTGASFESTQWADNRYRFTWQVPSGTTSVKLQITCPDAGPALKIGRRQFINLTGANGGFDGAFASGIAPSWAFQSGTGTPTAETGIVHSGATTGGQAQRIAVTAGNAYYLSQAPTIDLDRLYLLMCGVYVVSGGPGRALIGWGNTDLISAANYQFSRASRKTGQWEMIGGIFRPGAFTNLLLGVNGAAQSSGTVYGGSSVSSSTPNANLAARAVDAIFDDLVFVPLHDQPGVFRAESPEMALSAAQTTVIPLACSLDMRLRRVTFVYTVATDANTGVSMRLGTAATDTYYASRTSDVSQAQGTQIAVQPTRTDIRAGTPLLAKITTNKTGTGSVKIVIEADAN